MTSPAYRDIQSLLLGFGVIASTILVSGGPIFLFATETTLAGWFVQFSSTSISSTGPPKCEHPTWSEAATNARRDTAATWLSSGAAAAMFLAFLLRQHAFKVFQEDYTGSVQTNAKGVRLPNPLWESVRAASGFAFLCVLAAITIYSWSLAVPLTMVCVPVLVLVQPFSLRKRPIRSVLLIAFLAANAFFLTVPPATRMKLLGDAPSQVASSCFDFYDKTIVPTMPREVRPYLPTSLINWLRRGQLGEALKEDFLVGLYEAARDFNCVGGMLFPVFCFVYWPLLILLTLIGGVLPAQRVDEEALTMKQLRLGILFVLSLVIGGVVGGVVWRSYSSSGLGSLQWG